MEFTEEKYRALGDEILKDFGLVLFEILDKNLKPRLGENWFNEAFKKIVKRTKKKSIVLAGEIHIRLFTN